jgi:thioredoxin 1
MKNSSRYLIVGALVVSIVAIMAAKKGGCPFVCAITGNESAVTQPQAAPVGEAEVSADEQLPRLIELGADKCVPCKMMAPVLDELRADYEGQLEVLFIDVWKNPDETKKYDVKIIPTQLFFDRSGKEFFRHEGFFAKEDILAKFSEFDIEFQAREADEDPSQEGQ